MPIKVLLLLALLAHSQSGSANDADNGVGCFSESVSQARISPNPNRRVPLAAVLRFEGSMPVRTTIDVSDGTHEWSIAFDRRSDPAEGLPIVGLRPGREHRFAVSIEDQNGDQCRLIEDTRLTTPELPSGIGEFPPIEVVTARPELMEPGVTFYSMRRNIPGRNSWRTKQQLDYARKWGMLVALNNAGEVVWYYRSDARISGIDRLANGNLFFHQADFRSVEIDLLGNTVNEWYAGNRPAEFGDVENPDAIAIPVQSLHHQPHEMPNGNFLAMSANARFVEDWVSDDFDSKAKRRDRWIMGDTIIEFQPDGSIVSTWNSFDYLDVYRTGFGSNDSYWHSRGFEDHGDWTHGNGVTYDDSDDSIIMSFRMQDAVIKVDRKSGEIKWILGDHADWPERLQSKLLNPLGSLRWPYHGHNPRVTHSDTVIMFDNGIFGTREIGQEKGPAETWSRAVEYRIDPDAMTVEQVWESDPPPDDGACNSWAMGDAHRFPATNNRFVVHSICFPKRANMSYDEFDLDKHYVADFLSYAHIREFREDSEEIVFEAYVRDIGILSWEVYGAVRSPGMYVTNLSPLSSR